MTQVAPEFVAGLFDPARVADERIDAALEAVCPRIWKLCTGGGNWMRLHPLRHALRGSLGEALKLTWAECLRRGRRQAVTASDWPVNASFAPVVEVFDGTGGCFAVPLRIAVSLDRLALGEVGPATRVQVHLTLAIAEATSSVTFHEISREIVLRGPDG